MLKNTEKKYAVWLMEEEICPDENGKHRREAGLEA